MDKHILHNIIHRDANNNSKDCPVCNGEITMGDKKEMMTKANAVLARKQSMGIAYAEDEKDLIEFTELAKKPDDTKTPAGKENPEHKEFQVNPLVDLISFAEKGTLPKHIKIMPVGEYNMPRLGGKVNITFDKIKDMVTHFNENIRAHTSQIGLPIDVEHGVTQWKDAAAGWLKKLYAKADGIWADVDWTTLGQKLLSEKLYKLYSPEFFFEYDDPQYGFQMKNVMTGGALVNKPMIKDDLPPVVLGEQAQNDKNKNLTNNKSNSTIYLEITNSPTNHSMQLSEIVKKAKTDRTSDEQKFLVDHQDELTFAEAKTEGLVPAKTTAEEKPQAGMVTLSESQVKQLQEDAAAGKAAAEQLRKSNLKEEVKKIVFTEKGSKMKTDQIDKAVELLMTMSEAQAKVYKEQLQSLPEPVQFEEIGSSKALNISDNPQSQWDTLAKARAAEKKISYAEAENELGKENPELRDAAYATKTA